MRNYAASGQQATCTTTLKTALGLTGGTTTRPAIQQLLIGTSSTPADNALTWIAQRYTAAGTSTAVVPKPLNSGDPVCIATAGQNHSVEPTYTSAEFLFKLALHQKASHIWQALPGCEWVLPATASNGVGIGALSAAFTGALDASIVFAD